MAPRFRQFIRSVRIEQELFWSNNKPLWISDALIGLPAAYSQGIDAQVEHERLKFLVIELSPHVRIKTDEKTHESNIVIV